MNIQINNFFQNVSVFYLMYHMTDALLIASMGQTGIYNINTQLECNGILREYTTNLSKTIHLTA